jgi:hypothetical protein
VFRIVGLHNEIHLFFDHQRFSIFKATAPDFPEWEQSSNDRSGHFLGLPWSIGDLNVDSSQLKK